MTFEIVKKPPRETQPENLYLTPLARSLLLKSIKHGSRFGLHPYGWDERTGRMVRSTERWRLATWHLNVLLPIVYFVFVVIRGFQTLQDAKSTRTDVIMAGFGIAFYLFPVTFQLTYLFCGDEIPGLINQGLKLLEDMSKETPPVNLEPHQRYPSEVRIAEFYNCIIYYGFQSIGILVLIFGFTFPETKFLASSLHQDPRDLIGNPYRILSALFLVYITGSYVVSGWLLAMGLATVPFPLCVTLNALSHKTMTSKTLHHYRCLQLWVAKFNRIHSPLLLPVAEVLLIALTTLGIVGVIRFPGLVGSVVGHVGGTAYTIMYLLFSFFATIDTRSRVVAKCWKYGAGGAAARFQLAALRPISVTIGSYFFIDKCLILTTTHLVVTNSIALLLAE